MTKKVYLDPGHGGTDPGAVGNGLREKDITLAIATRIKNILVNEYQNVSVRMSRTGDQTVSLAERTNDANRWGADFFLSIHINAGGGTGYEDYIHSALSDSSKTAQLRNVIHAEIARQIGLRNRGKKKSDFQVLRNTRMHAMLTENGFIDHKEDAAKMKSSTWLDKVARGHANGLVKAFSLQKKQTGGIKMEFSSPNLEAETELSLASKARREIIVKKAVEAGANKSWLDKLNTGTITEGDIAGLAIKYVVDTFKSFYLTNN